MKTALGFAAILTCFFWMVPIHLTREAPARPIAAAMQLEAFVEALTAYKADTGAFPTGEQGLEALRTKPPGASKWSGPYLRKDIPPDPWGRPFQYRYPGHHGDLPDIVSLGADGRPGGDGIDSDIVSWKN